MLTTISASSLFCSFSVVESVATVLAQVALFPALSLAVIFTEVITQVPISDIATSEMVIACKPRTGREFEGVGLKFLDDEWYSGTGSNWRVSPK